MAVAARNIQALKNETGKSNNDMATYGQYWFGRNNCNLNEFLGKSSNKYFTWTYTNGAFHSLPVPDIGTVVTMVYGYAPGGSPDPPGGEGGDGGGEGGSGDGEGGE